MKVLVYQEEVGSSLSATEGDTVCLVGQAVEKHAIRAYGASRDLFALAESCRFFFKIRGTAGRNEIGTWLMALPGTCLPWQNCADSSSHLLLIHKYIHDGVELDVGNGQETHVDPLGQFFSIMEVLVYQEGKYSCIRGRCRPVART